RTAGSRAWTTGLTGPAPGAIVARRTSCPDGPGAPSLPAAPFGRGGGGCETARAEAVLCDPRGRLRRGQVRLGGRQEAGAGESGRRGRRCTRRDIPVLAHGTSGCCGRPAQRPDP